MPAVFFYGLFMDEDLLRGKGLRPSSPVVSYVEDYGLRIGSRATLLPVQGERAYGTVMELDGSELASLYGESSVADYVPEQLTAVTLDGEEIPAVSYLLPEQKLVGQNEEYLESLITVAEKIGLPDEYVARLKSWSAENP